MQDCQLVVQASLDDVAAATRRIRALLPPRLGDEVRDRLELGIAEALTNVVRHGYEGDSSRSMQVRLHEAQDELWVEITDSGLPIPPGLLAQAGPAAFDFDPTDLQALPESGMGLPLIRSVFDRVGYASGPGWNRLTLVRRT